jgi:hypothetical protein
LDSEKAVNAALSNLAITRLVVVIASPSGRRGGSCPSKAAWRGRRAFYLINKKRWCHESIDRQSISGRLSSVEMAEKNQELRNQALVGLALATLGAVVRDLGSGCSPFSRRPVISEYP